MVKQTINNQLNLVYFDVETSGLDYKTSEILQLSALTHISGFNRYIMPLNKITNSEFHGITLEILYKNNAKPFNSK